MSPDEGQKPTPDPTVLTTEQLLREVDRVKELMQSELEGLGGIIEEKFRSVARQLDLVEHQRVEQKADTKAAVDAALTAQKEAVKEQTTASERAIAKSEASTTKQLEQLNATFATAIKGVTDVLNDVKERVGKIESVKQGVTESKASFSSNANLALTILGALVSVLAIAVVVILANGGGP